jgi:hypothetical protein
MPEYVIERDMPGIGQLGKEGLKAAARQSCAAMDGLGSDIQWVRSYVGEDKIYCIYRAPSEDIIREHARISDLPVTSICEVRTMIDPSIAND